jgi:hypothetical protein
VRHLATIGLSGILLAGCVQEINFRSSRTIFRGTWNGTASQSDNVMTVRLNLTSEYVLEELVDEFRIDGGCFGHVVLPVGLSG